MIVPETPKTEVNNATVPEMNAAIITLKCLTKSITHIFNF